MPFLPMSLFLYNQQVKEKIGEKYEFYKTYIKDLEEMLPLLRKHITKKKEFDI